MSPSSTTSVNGGEISPTGEAWLPSNGPKTPVIAAGKGDKVQKRRVSKRLERRMPSEHDVFGVDAIQSSPEGESPTPASPSNHRPRVSRLQLPKSTRQAKPSSSLQPSRQRRPETTSDDDDDNERSSSLPPPTRQTTRPSVSSRSVSDPTPITRRPKSIDKTIKDYIQKPVNIESTKGKKTGFIYVVPVLHGNTLVVKIGQTTEPYVEHRIRNIKSTCGRTLNFKDRRNDLDDIQVETYYRRIEALAHAELSGFRYSFECACNRVHQEYFDVGEEVAHAVVRKWARFCEKMPWNERGLLKPWWGDRLGRVDFGVVEGEGEKEKENCHRRRHVLWEGFVDASRLDWAWYEVRQWGPSIWKFRWQVWCVVLSCTNGVGNGGAFSLVFWITVVAFAWRALDYTSPTIVGNGSAKSWSLSPKTPPRRSRPGGDGDLLPGTPHTGDSTLIGDSPVGGYGEGKRGGVCPGHWEEEEEEEKEGQEGQAHGDEEDIDLTYLTITTAGRDADSSDDDMGRDDGEISIIVSDVSEELS